jgi:hypothetical protein
VHVALIVFALQLATSDPELVAALRILAVSGSHQIDDIEVAAFLVRDGDGLVSCVMWPNNRTTRSAHFQGVIPDGTVALASTWLPDGTFTASIPPQARCCISSDNRIGRRILRARSKSG